MNAASRGLLTRVVVIGAAATVLPLVGPAPGASALVVPIPMGVGVRSVPSPSNATEHEVCVYGRAASASSRWDLLVTGTRYYDPFPQTEHTAADVTGWVIDERRTYFTPMLDACITIPHARADAGHFQATLVYTGVGTDVAGVLVGRGTWVGNFSDSNSTSLGSPPMP